MRGGDRRWRGREGETRDLEWESKEERRGGKVRVEFRLIRR